MFRDSASLVLRSMSVGSLALLLFALSGCSQKAPSDSSEPPSDPCNAVASPCSQGGSSGDSTAPNENVGGSQTTSDPPTNTEGPPTGVVGVGPIDPTEGDMPQDPDPASAADAGSATFGCDIGVADPNDPPEALTLSGSLGAHDPVIIAAHDQYYYFSTGRGISAKVSPDLTSWAAQPEVFPATPEWFQQLVPAYQPRNIWAPDVSYFGGQYHLYYSVSSFGDNRSCIGHATRAALNAGEWTDHAQVFCSNQPGDNQNFNAIDPNVILDESGTPWMAFGSFWSGIYMIRLNQAGEREGTELVQLASRGGGSIEAPFIVRRCGYYYLFVSFGACCQGVDSTYNINVGRSTALLGPYVDKVGTPMLQSGGTLLLREGGDWVGPGHNAVLFVGTKAYNIYHAYAATNGASMLRISELVWDAEGWPVSGGP